MAKKQTGLTLVELMVTLAVAIILIAVGVPLFSGVADNNRATAQVNALSSALQLARSEAVKRGEMVSIRRAGANWSDGWRVFVDTDQDGVIDTGEEVLREWGALTGNPPPTIDAGGADFVSFVATGAQNAAAQIDFEFPDLPVARRCISVNLAGGLVFKREQPPAAWTCP